ncbi:IS3 family transposase [Candidatus Poriferisocius sp.]|uniref:IS3 family transposase n=1 Tax=Candidatus Poriferisocius sp. TaxID=3101276 RepID=UPI003B029F4E
MTADMAGFIDAQRTDHGVAHAVACRALGVAPSTFYKHLNRPVTAQQLRRQATDAEVKRAFDKSQGTYGSPRVRAQLRRDGIAVSKTTVEASMARQGLCARPKKKKGLTSQNPGAAAPSDLLGRDFSATEINQKWCGDFKEVKTAEGPVFLATVEDLWSRRMVGFATSNDYPTAELAKAAINTAVATRGGGIAGVIFHSDKGSQYTSEAFAAACRRLGIARSTGRTGNALDNAPAESFFSTLTHELIDRRAWTTRAQARQEITLWVHSWYNQHRLHSAIGMVPPIEYEQATTPNPQKQTLHD